ncbi:MAG: glycosyltransferase, partial [Candidatus Hodarchaeota archaeon]
FIVDDNSQDGTASMALEHARADPKVVVIQRPRKLGLGSAYRIGFRIAMDFGNDLILEMDADMSHNPKYIIKFLHLMKYHRFGIVLGSRYCKGGSIKYLSSVRRFISYVANFIARTLLGIRETMDVTSGFKLFDA